MPLLNICAITGNNMVIQVGLAFLSGEKEVDYNWAIDYIRDLMAEHSIEEPSSIVTDRELALIKCLDTQFPDSQHILCRWHVNMNVLAKTKRWFPAPVRVNGTIQRHPQFQEFIQSWNTLLASRTEHIYNQELVKFKAKYPTAAVRYCVDTWLLWKENLVACYINQRSHFGVTVTSPIEGCHATIKAFLQRGHGDLKGVFDRLKLFWTEQHASIQSTVAQQQLRPKHSVNVPLFAAILKQVHGYALERILKELKKLPARGPLPMCTCSIQQSIGLPCYHTLYQRKLSTGVVHLEDIHVHWHYSRPEPGPLSAPPLPVLNPLVVRGKGRPRGALGTRGRVAPTSTRREPSAFELPSSSAPPALAPTHKRDSM